MLISDSFWRRRFNADPNVVGKRLRFGAFSHTIAGVMPASFLFPERDVDVWAPSPMDAPFAQNRRLTWFTVIGRLKRGASVEQARANMAAVQADLGRAYGLPDSELAVEIVPLKETAVGESRQSLWVINKNIAKLPLMERTEWCWSRKCLVVDQHHPVCAGSGGFAAFC